MANWRSLARKLALSHGRIIDPKRAKIIKEALLADGKMDKTEFSFLIALRREAQAVDASFDDVVFDTMKPILLKNGGITPENAQWLKEFFLSDGRIDARERQFLTSLRESPGDHCQEFLDWCDDLAVAAANSKSPGKTKRWRIALKWPTPQNDSEKRWQRYGLAGLFSLAVMFAISTLWIGKNYLELLGPGHRGDDRRADNPLKYRSEFRIVGFKINDKPAEIHEDEPNFRSGPFDNSDLPFEGVRPMKSWASKEYFAFAPEPNREKIEFKIENEPKLKWQVKLRFTLEPQSKDQQIQELEIEARIDDQTRVFRTTKEGVTEEQSLIIKSGGSIVQAYLKNPGKKTVPVRVGASWRDDMEKVSLHILAIGVSDYQFPTEKLLNLKYAHKDAIELAKVLAEQGKGLFHDVPTKTVLINKEANKSNIANAFDAIMEPGKIKEQDLFVLILAGHGSKHPNYQGFMFLPYDFDGKKDVNVSEALPWSFFTDRLDYMGCRKVVIIDSCYSGAADRGYRTIDEIDDDEVQKALKYMSEDKSERGRVTIKACSKNQRAAEDEKYGGGHGVFSWTLLEILKGKEDKGIISVEKLCERAKDRVKELNRNQQTVNVYGGSHLSLQRIPITRIKAQ